MSEQRIAANNDRLVLPRARLWHVTRALVISAVVLAGSTARGGESMPDFALEDVNPTSATYGELVSPRGYEGKVSGWYFGHAT